MELNNKQDLKALLATTDLHLVESDGSFSSISAFEQIDLETNKRIFRETRENLRLEMNEQQLGGRIDLSALDIIQVCMRNVDLHTTSEVLHFVWECGRLHKELELKFEMQNRQDALEKENNPEAIVEKDPESPLAIAIQVDKALFDITSLIQRLPIPEFWPEMGGWTSEYQQQIDKAKQLLTKLY